MAPPLERRVGGGAVLLRALPAAAGRHSGPCNPLTTAMAKFVLWGTYCEDALTRRTPFRQEHLDGLHRQHAEGVLLTLGPTEGSTHVFGLYEADALEQVEALVHADVYAREGIWTEVQVYPWIQAIG
jgi:uncharacterized protein YciI